ARPHDPRHLGDAFGRLGHKEDHQRHGGGVEAPVGEGKRHRIALLEFGEARLVALARVGELALRGIDAGHGGGRGARDDQLGESAVAAADIDPAQARARRQPVEKNLTGIAAPDSHHPLVSGAVVETDFLFSHAVPHRRRRSQALILAMNFANAANCVLTMSLVGWSLSSSVSLSNLVCALPTKISGVPKMKALRNVIDMRQWYCMRAPPSGPCEQDWMATGFSLNGCSFMRESQSIAFFSTPGIDQLYSGVTNRTPSAARIAAARSSAGPGKPEESCTSAL